MVFLFCYTIRMNYFLAKTDPSTYSIEDFQKEKITIWNGVRSAAAVKALQAMKKGDKVLIYHSQGEGSIRGLAVVTKQVGADPDDTKSWLVALKLTKVFTPTYVTLKQVKATGKFATLPLVYQSRLSTMPLTVAFIAWLRSQGIAV